MLVPDHLTCQYVNMAVMQDVAILDVRGSVRTKLQSTNAKGCRLEMSEYFADYDTYLEGHIPGEHPKQEPH